MGSSEIVLYGGDQLNLANNSWNNTQEFKDFPYKWCMRNKCKRNNYLNFNRTHSAQVETYVLATDKSQMTENTERILDRDYVLI